MDASPPDLTGIPGPGAVVAGKYELERLLGAGGMGAVVAARHLVLGQPVAIKFLLPGAARLKDAGARFLREAKAAAAITSEHVARVLDMGTLESGAPYMVMEYLSGADLGRLVKTRGPLPPPEAVDLVLQACEAIAEAHALGIVHRDLKLGNLFLTARADGSPLVKVLDFGLSKTLIGGEVSEASLTATDVILGSPYYMSPEQIRSLKTVDARTDIWSIGVILYVMLSARRPFGGETASAICASVAADAPPPLLSVRADLPPALDAVIGRCLEKDVSRRFQHVGELATALAPFSSPAGAISVERIRRVLPVTMGGPERAPQAPPIFGPGCGAPEASAFGARSSRLPERSSPALDLATGGHERAGGETGPRTERSVGGVSWAEPRVEAAPRGRSALVGAAAGGVVLGGIALAVVVWVAARPTPPAGPSAASTAVMQAPPPTTQPSTPAPAVDPPSAAPPPPLPAATATATTTASPRKAPGSRRAGDPLLDRWK